MGPLYWHHTASHKQQTDQLKINAQCVIDKPLRNIFGSADKNN